MIRIHENDILINDKHVKLWNMRRAIKLDLSHKTIVINKVTFDKITS
jgi:hypothetical protein